MTSGPPAKRQRLEDDSEDESFEDSDVNAASMSSVQEGSDEEDSPDTEDEINNAQHQKSRQTSKRKLRATKSDNFGATLQSLLQTNAPSSLPLSLKPSVARKRNDEKLEVKARKVLLQQKRENEDKRRITDVIGGWGGESERALRKVAQRGGLSCLYVFLVSLLNLILSGKTV